MEYYVFYILFACQLAIFLFYTCKKISTKEIENFYYDQVIVCILLYPSFYVFSFLASSKQEWLFFEIGIPLLFLSLCMLIVSKILSVRYKKSFLQERNGDIYSRSLKDLSIPEEKQSLLRERYFKLKTNHSSPSPRQVAQEIEFSQLSSLRDKISLHDETCEELFKEWTLNHTFKKKIHIFNVKKESKEREEFSSFCPKKREKLSQEKDEIIKQIDFFTSKKEETPSDDFFEKEEKELNDEISRLQASFFSISGPKECSLFQKQYEALKECFIQCKEEYRSSKDKLQKAKTEENMQEKEITTLFPDFYAKN